MRFSNSTLLLAAAVVLTAAEPLRLHPDNPHYFFFRGKPTVLVTSGEHYGGVLNGEFNYRKYLDTLASNGLNLTRIFSGVYREVPGSFNITRNTLAPAGESTFVTPFRRVAPMRYDLSAWNNEYFRRLEDFVSEAGKRGIIVEITLFTVFYNDTHWSLSPLNAKNNLQGTGKVAYNEVFKLREPALTAVQESLVRKIVTELKDFDNLYYEVCNEPYIRDEASPEWQARITSVIEETESALGTRHLVSWNIANHEAEVRNPHPGVSIFNFHYARPPRTVEMNYGLAKPIGMNETGFDGTMDAIYRIQGWDFLLAGGALYNNLDYSFAVGFEDGTFPVPGSDPGWGSPRLRTELRTLREFMDSLPFTRMHPDASVVKDGIGEGASIRVLSEVGKTYAGYIHHGRIVDGYRPNYIVGTRKTRARMQAEIPAGKYQVEWTNPSAGSKMTGAAIEHAGGMLTLETPEYSEDIAFVLRRL